ncbi:TonB-dependent receptor [Larkinella soli]|uniref:TonB-dependent receptor n=1 Tax=Larkinella soli TaxID=1770527 RepID=UPI000FFBE1CA|nr:TonB-dependent receptor [Larkinella soli]
MNHFSACCLLFLLTLLNPGASAQRLTLSGKVEDGATGKPLPGAGLSVLSVGAGTTTNDSGRYVLDLPRGSYLIQISAVGYKTALERVVLNADRSITFRLQSRTIDLDEVQVKDRREDQNVEDVRMGRVQIDVQQLKKLPMVLGEPDILKALVLQAGVTTAGEGAGGFNVRGGRTDQNLVLLDGAPLFNTSHLLGFYTNVSPDVVQDINLYKGTFSAQYGGRTSSLLLMTTRPGNADAWRVSGGISPISGRVVVDGPIAKKLTLLAGGRIAFPSWVLQLFPQRTTARESRAFFYDGNFKLQFTPNATNTISLSGYRSQDRFKFPGDTLYGWQSNVASVRWSSLLTRNLQLNVTGLYSGYQFSVDGQRASYEFDLTAAIRHREVKADLYYTLRDRHRIQVGLNGISYQVQKGNIEPVGDASSINPKRLEPENAREGGAYLHTEWTLTPSLTLQAGLRYSAYALVGPRTIYRYEAGVVPSRETITDSTLYGSGQTVKTYGGWEPRLGLRFQFGPATSLKLNYSRMRQYLQLISNTTAITPVDFWKASDPFVPAQVADQYSVGIFQNLADNAVELSLEGYYKTIDNLVEYRNGATLLLNETLETDLLKARGRAYGLEFSLAKNRGRLTGQLNYVYARSLVAVQTPFSELLVNRGEWYPSNFDKPHNLNVQARLAMKYKWTFVANFVYSTGIPATYPDGQYVFDNQPTLNYSRRNADRVPAYHRLDVSFSKDTRLTAAQTRYGIWTLGVYNVYARKNPYSIYFTRVFSSTRSYRLAIFGMFIPSITYNFYF